MKSSENDELKVRQESIDLLKGRLKSQITSFKETIAKVLDKDTSLGEMIRTLFREQGIKIASILTIEHPLLELLGLDKQLRLLGWPSGYLLKHYYQAVGVLP